MPDAAPLLRLQGLCKSYAIPVLVDADFDVLPGEVHALVGANGAGKSTLARIVCGLTEATAGTMDFAGQPYAPATKADAEAAGVHMVMQELNLVNTLSVAENLFLSRLPRRYHLIDYRALHTQAQSALSAVGLETIDPAMPVSRLGIGHQQLIEIAAALTRRCRLLILDEPTAALTDPQVDLLFKHIKRLKEEGVGIIYISHRMDELRRISDRVTILRDGRVVASEPTNTLSLDEIVRHMVGQDPIEALPQSKRTGRGPVAMRVERLCRGERVQDVSFDVHGGEILGLAGLVGSGRTETLRAIFGADRPDSGQIRLGEDLKPATIRRPHDAVRAGIGLIPEDRKQHGLLLSQAIRPNITLASMKRLAGAGGWIDQTKERTISNDLRDRLAIQATSVEQPTIELSGGNQQKVIIARWLLRDCDVLLFDEPTRGIDIAARQTIYQLLRDLARRGKALVVVSSDLRELMSLCDRIAVLSAGRLVQTFEPTEWTHDAIMAAAISGYLNVSPSTQRA